MAYFHSNIVRKRAGPGHKDRVKVIGETIEEQKDLKRRFPDATTINWPPTRDGKYKSRSLPEVWLDANRQDILDEIESCKVPEPYIKVLTMMMRELWWKRTHHWNEEMEKYFELNIRGKTIGLIVSGLVIKDTENPNLQNLHRRLEKIDLGRRTDLNLYSGVDLANRKYDQDLSRTDLDTKLSDQERAYRDGNIQQQDEIEAQLIQDGLRWKIGLFRSRHHPERTTPY